MKIADILEAKGRTVHSVRPWATVEQVVQRLGELGIGALLVVDERDAIRGIVSERDVVRALAQEILEGASSFEDLESGEQLPVVAEALRDQYRAMNASRRTPVSSSISRTRCFTRSPMLTMPTRRPCSRTGRWR